MKRTGIMSIRDILRHRHGFGLTVPPPFAPAAETCARVTVESNI